MPRLPHRRPTRAAGTLIAMTRATVTPIIPANSVRCCAFRVLVVTAQQDIAQQNACRFRPPRRQQSRRQRLRHQDCVHKEFCLPTILFAAPLDVHPSSGRTIVPKLDNNSIAVTFRRNVFLSACSAIQQHTRIMCWAGCRLISLITDSARQSTKQLASFHHKNSFSWLSSSLVNIACDCSLSCHLCSLSCQT